MACACVCAVLIWSRTRSDHVHVWRYVVIRENAHRTESEEQRGVRAHTTRCSCDVALLRNESS